MILVLDGYELEQETVPCCPDFAQEIDPPVPEEAERTGRGLMVRVPVLYATPIPSGIRL